MSGNISCRDVEGKRSLKRRVEEEPEFDHDLLDLSLSSYVAGHESMKELNLVDGFDSISKSPVAPDALNEVQEKKADEQPEEERYYLCKYCNKKFYNSRALGGHQNAHKYEKGLLKRKNRGLDMAAFKPIDSPLYQNLAMAGLPLHHVPLNRALGFPFPYQYPSLPPAGLWYGNGGWSKPQVGMNQPDMNNYLVGSSGFQPPVSFPVRGAFEGYSLANSGAATNGIPGIGDSRGNGGFSRNQQRREGPEPHFRI